MSKSSQIQQLNRILNLIGAILNLVLFLYSLIYLQASLVKTLIIFLFPSFVSFFSVYKRKVLFGNIPLKFRTQ